MRKIIISFCILLAALSLKAAACQRNPGLMAEILRFLFILAEGRCVILLLLVSLPI